MNSTRPMSLSMCGLFLAALSAASACGPLTSDELAQSTERLTGCRGIEGLHVHETPGRANA